MPHQMLHLPTNLTIQDLFHFHQVALTCQKYTIQQTQQPQSKQVFLQRLMINYSDQGNLEYYQQQFINIYMLIKLNSLSRPQCKINQQFLAQFAKFYSENKILKIQVSKNQRQLFSQIIVLAGLHSVLDQNALQNILEGQALLAATIAMMIKRTKQYLKKCQISFCLSFLAMSGRQIAFTHKVHAQKNHKGEVYFADLIYSYIDIDSSEHHKRIQIESRRVQDPYSMRCSPQVYGVAYDTLEHVQYNYHSLLNKFHFKNVILENVQYPNLDLYSDSAVLQGDYLICSLNEIGSISFLRCERILNSYLGKNQLSKQKSLNLQNLKMLMQRTVHCVSDNKIISTPSNIDTMNIDDYQKDVFFTQCKIYEKFQSMMKNLYKIMHLQILAGIEGLNNVYNINNGQIFKNDIFRQQFFLLSKNISLKDKKKSFEFIQNEWKFLQ